MNEEERLDFSDLDSEIQQRVEEYLKYSLESSDSYNFCSQELLDYSLRGIASIKD